MQVGLMFVVDGAIFAILLPVLTVMLSDQDTENSLCIPVGGSISTPFSILYACMSILLFSAVCILYTIIMFSITKSSKISKRDEKTKHVLIRIGAVILTNFIALLLITLLSLVSMFHTSVYVEAMVAFMVFPLNSCLNPIVTTITTARFLADSNFKELPELIRNNVIKLTKTLLKVVGVN